MKLRHINLADLDPDLPGKYRKARTNAVRSTDPAQKMKATCKVSIKTNNNGRCPYTGKIRYKDDQAAKAALRRIQSAAQIEFEMAGHSNRHEKRWFDCAKCSGKHLTSQTEVEYRSACGKAA